MKVATVEIKLFWSTSFGRLVPFCESNIVSENDIDLLSCLLMDDGGLSLNITLAWLDECLRQINDVVSLRIESQCWARETWGVMIRLDGVEIYSLIDESCYTTLDLNSFHIVLSEWKNFIISEPQLKKIKYIAI